MSDKIYYVKYGVLMSKALYHFKDLGKGKIALLESGMIIVKFLRASYRHDLEHLNRGNGCLDSILRFLNRACPPSILPASENASPLELKIRTIGHKGITEYLRFKIHSLQAKSCV